MSPITVALVDDHRVVARGLQLFLEAHPDLRVLGIATSGEELLARVQEWQPRLVILDLLMPGGIDGIETMRRLKVLAPDVRVIALTASTDEARRAGALRAGASGYVRKDADPEVLLDAIRAVARGRQFFEPAALDAAPTGDLSGRELEVLREAAHGLTNREIAERLGIGEETVRTHVSRLLSKLGVQHRAQLVASAVKLGAVSFEDL